MTQIATLGGINLNAADTITWVEKVGVSPHTQIFTLVQGQGETLFNQAKSREQGEGVRFDQLSASVIRLKGIDLVIKSDKRPTRTWQDLYVLRPVPSDQPYLRKLLVADRRWLWPYKRVVGRYNVRRRTGGKSKVGEQLIELEPFSPDQKYVPASLFADRDIYTAKMVLEDVLNQLVGQGGYIIPDGIDLRLREMPIENLEIDDPGNNGLSKALSRMGGITVKVDKTGKVIVVDQLNQKEKEIFGRMTAGIDGAGYITNLRNRLIRPREVHVLFTREMEVRFDFSTAVVGSITAADRDNRTMQNVLPLPDPETTINGVQYGQGSWVEFLDEGVFTAWGAGPTLKGYNPLPKLTVDHIRRDFLFGQINATYGQLGKVLSPDVLWQQRAATVMQHFRQTFQLNRRWVDRSLSIKPWRVSLLDPVNGTFARAPAYMNYCVKPSIRGILKDPANSSYWYNVEGYNDDLDKATQSPAVLRIIDPQIGIVRLNFIQHPLGWTQEYFPSAVDGIPTADLAEDNNIVSINTSLRETHDVSIILTMVPGYPNNTSQFHRIQRNRFDAESVLGIEIAPEDRNDYGPILEVRVPPSYGLTARTAWSDDDADFIEAAFGIGVSAVNPEILDKKLQALIVNEEELDVIADAIAAAAYLQYADRIIGTLTNDISDIDLDGLVQQVVTTLAPNGVCTTSVKAAAILPKLDFFAAIPDHIRRVIMRQVQAPGGDG